MADNYILHGYPTGQSVEAALNKGRDSVTESEVTSRLATKRDKLSSRQLQAVDSGITADTYTNIVSAIQTVESEVIANIPAGQDLTYASNITVEMNPNTYEITIQL